VSKGGYEVYITDKSRDTYGVNGKETYAVEWRWKGKAVDGGRRGATLSKSNPYWGVGKTRRGSASRSEELRRGGKISGGWKRPKKELCSSWRRMKSKDKICSCFQKTGRTDVYNEK